MSASRRLDLVECEFRFDGFDGRTWSRRDARISSAPQEILEYRACATRAGSTGDAGELQSLTDRDDAPERSELARGGAPNGTSTWRVYLDEPLPCLSRSRATAKSVALGGWPLLRRCACSAIMEPSAEFAAWMRVQKARSPRERASAQHLAALQAAVTRFFPIAAR